MFTRSMRCGDKSDPNHYATVRSVTKPFHLWKPSAENLSTWCENTVQDKRSLARRMNIIKIYMNEGMISSWIKNDSSRFHLQLRHSLQTVSAYFIY
ncbi:hypothetical protein AVEN_18369-1 [Araneus ventricosus]|uniref:Uncharacterized protein n=1 Tax=Araneus ventricosus TaxID=182803 RepID=A0A4Y2NR38_ARAVE|nr:hypothetical protein AVEN_18369-1 [Araneus ventricosus]